MSVTRGLIPFKAVNQYIQGVTFVDLASTLVFSQAQTQIDSWQTRTAETMTYGESMRVSHRATGETSSGELSRQGNGIGSSWILSGSGAPSTGILLVVATLITLAGGLVAQGPLKPIVISKAPPVTGEYPEFRDFISFNNRGRILSAAAKAD
ncbi:hypothetical protein M9434_006697 [Picochlorum sp. BPE23]|nr:hypothetical protein M9434_006697 [Picochlorum sp. BPE23]